MTPVTDERDTRVLIPRVRRAIEGPDAPTGSAAVAAGGLTDDQVNAAIADAIAGISFYSEGLFGHELIVAERDPDYLAPIAWLIDPALSAPEETVIVAQAALDHFFNTAKGMVVSQEITDEGQTWKWSKSASMLTDQLKSLREDRDRALDLIAQAGISLADDWISTIAMRDAQTSAIIEPWVGGGGLGGQTLGGDPRFGTWV